MRLLLVADDPTLARDPWIALTTVGYTCERAMTAPAAKPFLVRMGPARFDVVIVDPDLCGGSGWDLLEWLRRRTLRPSVVVLSQSNGAAHRTRGWRLGVDDYLSSTMDIDDLCVRLEVAVRRHQALDALALAGHAADACRLLW